jgi:hypothetical protein
MNAFDLCLTIQNNNDGQNQSEWYVQAMLTDWLVWRLFPIPEDHQTDYSKKGHTGSYRRILKVAFSISD